MIGYIFRRSILMVFIIMAASIAVFSIMYLVPGDPAEIIAKQIYGPEISSATIEVLREDLGLEDPVYIQYLRWLKNIAKGDFGFSYMSGKPVIDEIASRLPATFQLALGSMTISLLIAIPLGIASALKHNTFIDYLSMLSALIGVSVPNFWLGLILIMVFSVNLGLLPVYGHGSFLHLILPSITLGTGLAAMTTRMMRNNMLEELKKDYIRTAESKGLGLSGISRHAAKNAILPVVTIVGLQLGSLIEGTVIVEVVFAWPGIGGLLVDSIFARDFPIIQGCVMLVAVIYAFINLVVDISYTYLDPRINYKRFGI